MDAKALLARFDAGVRYTCGCEERGLHPAVVRGIESGAVPVSSLLRCAEHGAPIVEDTPAAMHAAP